MFGVTLGYHVKYSMLFQPACYTFFFLRRVVYVVVYFWRSENNLVVIGSLLPPYRFQGLNLESGLVTASSPSEPYFKDQGYHCLLFLATLICFVWLHVPHCRVGVQNPHGLTLLLCGIQARTRGVRLGSWALTLDFTSWCNCTSHFDSISAWLCPGVPGLRCPQAIWFSALCRLLQH